MKFSATKINEPCLTSSVKRDSNAVDLPRVLEEVRIVHSQASVVQGDFPVAGQHSASAAVDLVVILLEIHDPYLSEWK